MKVKMNIYDPGAAKKEEPPREIFVALRPLSGYPGVSVVRLVNKNGCDIVGGMLLALSPKGYYVMKWTNNTLGVQLGRSDCESKKVSFLADLI